MMQTKLTITRPDDWHLHLRDGELMRSVVGATARAFGRAIVMPNLDPPVTTVAAAAAYRERIAAALGTVTIAEIAAESVPVTASHAAVLHHARQ